MKEEILSIVEIVTRDLKAAMKEQNKFKTKVLRMVLSELKYASLDQDKVSELKLIGIISSYRKKLTDSLATYTDSEQKDSIANEIALIDHYLRPREELSNKGQPLPDTPIL